MRIEADLTNMGEYMAVVGGILQAAEDPRFQGDFTEHLTKKVRTSFMTETLSAHASGYSNLDHVFEWGAQTPSGVSLGRPSNIPLFRLTTSGLRDKKIMSYIFLPSTKPVPLPNPEKYGFSSARTAKMRRHTFQLKALIMETRNRVTIRPRGSGKLFVPLADHPRGFIMTPRSVSLNPGGPGATGGFAAWWQTWFNTRAPVVTQAESRLTEQMLGETGRKLTRYAAGTVVNGRNVGGQFARSRGVSTAYVDSKAREVKAEVLAVSKAFFDRDKWEGTWE